jgi:hypothetical protein
MLPDMLPTSFTVVMQGFAGKIVKVMTGALLQFGFLVSCHFVGKVGI